MRWITTWTGWPGIMPWHNAWQRVLGGLPGLQREPPQTNYLFVDLLGPARERSTELLEHLKVRGILATGLYRLRFVTHLDVDAAGIDRAIAAIAGFFEA